MGFSEIFASYEWFGNYIKNLTNVTPQDVQRVAKEYFAPKNRIVGVYSPTGYQTEIVDGE